MIHRPTLPGDWLYEAADLLFGTDPYAQSLFALIADGQEEWRVAVSRFARAGVRVRLIAVFWQSALLHLLYRATRPPSARAAASIALSVALTGTTMGGVYLWLSGGDWPSATQQMFSSMPFLVSIPLANAGYPGDILLGSVPKRDLWRTFHQFTVVWVALATVWTIDTGAPAWLPILAAVNALAARVIAAWLQRRRDRREARR